MRALVTSVATLAAAALSPPTAVDAFVVPASPPSSRPVPYSLGASSGCDECATSELAADDVPSLANAPDGAEAIRSAVVTNSAGELVRIDDAIRSSGADANAPHVVIYLRHMG